MVIHNPQGAYGYTDLRTQLWAQEATFKASAVIAAKSVVAIGTTGQVATAATNGSASLAIGIAQGAGTTNGDVQVVVQGIVENVPANGAIAAGAIVIRSGTTAGAVAASATPAVGEALGVAIAASASNLVTVWVYNR